MTAEFSTSAQLTNLLNAAQVAAIRQVDGRPATRANLEQLASLVRVAVLQQVALGLWDELGVHDVDDLRELVVTAELGNRLRGEPPIKVCYDFTQTSRPHFCVESVVRV